MTELGKSNQWTEEVMEKMITFLIGFSVRI
jgi:hypothetical protein